MGEITNHRRGLAAAVGLSVIAGLLAACSDGPIAPAPVYLRGAASVAAKEPPPSWRENRIVTVRHGETLGDIALGYHVPERSLIAANNLRSPYLLRVGDRLVLPDRGAPPEQQAMTPPFAAPYPATLSPAPTQMAVIPPRPAPPQPAPVQVAALPAAHPAPPPAAQPQTAVVPPRPTMPAQTVTAAPLAPPTQIAALPPRPTTPAQTVTAAPHPPPPPQIAAAPTQPPSSAAKLLPDIVPLDAPPKSAAAAEPARPVNPSDPPPVMPARNPAAALPLPGEPAPTVAMEAPGGRFPWPVHGRVLANYGSANGGAHNEGINIAAPLGTLVRSIDSGTVAYVGNEVKGYGNLVLVKHANGWISAYAHLNDVMVKKGDTVSTGEVIGKVGDTGSVGEPQLHFELRRGKKPVDPKEFLEPAGSATARSGQKVG